MMILWYVWVAGGIRWWRNKEVINDSVIITLLYMSAQIQFISSQITLISINIELDPIISDKKIGTRC